MNLRAFLNRDVFVQFRGHWYLVVSNEHSQPDMAWSREKALPPPTERGTQLVQLAGEPPPKEEPKPALTPLLMPFAQGRFVEIDGEVLFSYVPDPVTGKRVDVWFHPDAIFSVAMVRPEPAVST